MSIVDQVADEQTTVAPVTSAGRARILRRFLTNRLAVLGLAYLLVLLVIAALAPVIARYDPQAIGSGVGAPSYESPSGQHWLGTDNIGRDNASRLVFGVRFAVRDAIQVVSIVLLVGVPLGVWAGYRRGWLDLVLLRVMDAIHSVPVIVIALVFAGIFNQSLTWALIGVAVGLLPSMVRIARSATLSVREELFIDASRLIGTPTHQILLRRVLPNIAGPILVQASIFMGGAIFLEAALSILGVGYEVGAPAWGVMLNDAYQNVHASLANVAYPSVAIGLTILAFNLVGDGLQEAIGSSRNLGRRQLGLTAVRRQAQAGQDGEPEPGTRRFRWRPVKPLRSAVDPTEALLQVEGLTIQVRSQGESLTVVDDVSFDVRPGEVVGLVGESGAGKSVTSLAIMRLLTTPPFQITGGSIRFQGEELLDADLPRIRAFRGGSIGMVFQDPMQGLNPGHTVGAQIVEAIRLHSELGRRAARARALELLQQVEIPNARDRLSSYPHELSGGMRQRALIAMALAASPQLLIADEPTTALDVTVQDQILTLIKGLQQELHLGVLFVTHDLGVVADICDRVNVMYAGQIVEHSDVYSLFAAPSHPYTAGLLGAVAHQGGAPTAIPGQVPELGDMPHGCRFAPRCDHAIDLCSAVPVELVPTSTGVSRCIRTAQLESPTELDLGLWTAGSR